MLKKSTKYIDKCLIPTYNCFIVNRKKVNNMSEKEKNVVEKLKKAIPNMSDFDKGYILGKVEGMVEKKECIRENDEDCLETGVKK